MRKDRSAVCARMRVAAALLVVLSIALLRDDGVAARPFHRTPAFTAASNASRLVAADFDGDGRLDVAVAGSGHPWDAAPAATVGILFGAGGGMYRWGGTVYTSTLTDAPVLFGGDFNQDSKQDLFLESGCCGAYKGVTLLGQGNGTFAPMPVVDYPGQVYPGDCNADGRLDLIVPSGTATTTQVRVYLGALDGSFVAQTPFLAPAALNFTKLPFTAGDLNGDRRADLMVTPASGNSAVVVLLGVGNGTFTVGQSLATGLTNRTGYIGDVTGDGAADFVVLFQDSLSHLWLRVYGGHGDGTLDPAPSYNTPVGDAFDETVTEIVSGDLNGDGRPDMAAIGGDVAWLYLGSATGLTGLGSRSVGYRTQAILIGDFDGAGQKDLAVAAFSDTVTFVLARPDGTYAPPSLPSTQTSFLRDLLISDFTGDGRLDVAALDVRMPPCEDLECPWGLAEVFPALPQGGFGPPTISQVGIEPQSLLAVDYDRDGKMDLVTVNSGNTSGQTIPPPGTLSLLRGHGDGSFDPEVAVQIGKWPTSAAAGDFDLDGDTDLAVAESNSNEVRILLRTAAGTYVAQPLMQAGRIPIRIVSADFDRDGKPDLAVATRGNYEVGILGAVSWYRGLGNGTFSAAVVLAQVNMSSDLAVEDLDADGDPDLVLTDQGNIANELTSNDGGATVLLNQGSGVFAPTSYSTARLARRVEVADFNGDGSPDLMTENSTLDLAFFPGLGGGAFGAPERISQWGCGNFIPTRLAGDNDVDLLALCGGIGAFENEAPFPDLRVANPFRLDWSPVSLAGRYDVVQGSLPVLRSTGGNFGAAVTACLQNDGTSATATLAQTPPAGSGFFYLARPVWPNGTPGSYDGEIPGQAAPRDASIHASAAACP